MSTRFIHASEAFYIHSYQGLNANCVVLTSLYTQIASGDDKTTFLGRIFWYKVKFIPRFPQVFYCSITCLLLGSHRDFSLHP